MDWHCDMRHLTTPRSDMPGMSGAFTCSTEHMQEEQDQLLVAEIFMKAIAAIKTPRSDMPGMLSAFTCRRDE
jgi:hypothetical protein